MTYTMRNARMSLADARDVLEHRSEAGWSPDQKARAKVVIAHWARIRRNQAKKETA
jgi:hypothetical protein